MRYAMAIVALGLAIGGCGGGGDGDDAPIFEYTTTGYPIVAGLYTVTERQTANSCEAVDPTPETFTVLITQTDDAIAGVQSNAAANRAALEAAGWTITASSGAMGTVTVDAHFTLTQGVTATHTTLGTINALSTWSGLFHPTSVSGTSSIVGVTTPPVGFSTTCTIDYSFTGTKNP